MGYTTEFEGVFKTNKPVDERTFAIIGALSKSDPGAAAAVKQYNLPPNIPGWYSQWVMIDGDRMTIRWNQGEKFQAYIDWIKYYVNCVLAPGGYVLNGTLDWQGQSIVDRGQIIIEDNVVTTVSLSDILRGMRNESNPDSE